MMKRMENLKRYKLQMVVFAAIGFVVLLLNVLPVGVLSAQEKKNREPNPLDNFQIDSITVTAEKQEENVQEVPIGITVLNNLAIEDRKIESVADMADFVPNLMIFQTDSSAVPVTRGISATIESMSVSTGLYVDGVPLLHAAGFEAGMLDIERIEILRGPQGTIYGKGAEVGAINIISRQPSGEFKGKVTIEGGQWLSSKSGENLNKGAGFTLSGPIQEEKMFFSLAGKVDQKAGYIKNTLTDESVNNLEKMFGKVGFYWLPNDKLDISLSASHLVRDKDGSQMNLSEAGAAMFMLPAPERLQVSSDLKDPYDRTTNDSQSLKIIYVLSDLLALTSVTTNWSTTYEGNMDYDFSPYTLMHNKNHFEFRKQSEELRLGYVKGDLKWLVGLYYDTDNNNINSVTTSMIPSMASSYDRKLDGSSQAVFANLNLPLTEKLSLVTGLRYEKEERNFTNKASDEKRNGSWDGISPKLALKYKVTPAIMTYLSAAKGYRSGGFNVTATESKYYRYDQEELWSYDLGVKSALLNNRLIVNCTLFYMNISDMQVAQALPSGFSYLTNAAKATGKGVELEMTARVTDGLSLIASYGQSDIKFDDFSDALGDYDENKNPWAPEHTYNFGAKYRHSKGFYARADYIGYGKTYFDKANTTARDAYSVANAKIGYELRNLDVYLYGKNIFDTVYDAEGVYGGYNDIYSEPGEFGLQLAYLF